MVTRRSDHAGRLKAGLGGSAPIPERIAYTHELRDMIRALKDGNEMFFVDQDTIEHLEARLAEQSTFVSWYQALYDELKKRVDRPYMVETQRGRDEVGRELARSINGWDWFVNEWTDRGSSAIGLRNMAAQLVQLEWLTQEQIADLDFSGPPSCPEMDAITAGGKAEWARYLSAREAILEKVSEYAPKRKRHPLSAQEARLTAKQHFVLSNCPHNEVGITEWITVLCQKDLLGTGLVMQIRNLITDILRPQRTMIG